jgi:hypothetical protein
MEKRENVTDFVTLRNGSTMRVGGMFLYVMLYCYEFFKIIYRGGFLLVIQNTLAVLLVLCTFPKMNLPKTRNIITFSGNPHKTYIVTLRFDIVKS